MKAWRLARLGGELKFRDVPVPEVRPGTVLVKVEATTLLSYLKAYVEGELTMYRAPAGEFTPGGNAVGIVHAVGRDVWHLKPGQRVAISSHLVSTENVSEPAQILVGMTSGSIATDPMQADWPDGTLAEYVLSPVSVVTPAEGLEAYSAAQIATISRYVVPYGGLRRGRLAAGETLVVIGASGAFGGAAVLIALAMGAGRVVAVGRNAAALDALVKLAGPRVAPVVLTGDVEADTVALRAAAGGGAHLAFDMIGQARDPNATLAGLNSLRRGGRLVLMGSLTAPLPISYMQVMLNNLEILGQWMYSQSGYREVIELVRTQRLDLKLLTTTTFPLASLSEAMEASSAASGLECVVVQA